MTSTAIKAARAKLVAATHSKIIMLQLSAFLNIRCKKLHAGKQNRNGRKI